MSKNNTGVTPMGKLVLNLIILGLFVFGGFFIYKQMQPGKGGTDPVPQPKADSGPAAQSSGEVSGIVETQESVPRLDPAATYQATDGILDIELSEYAGYAGLIAANNGLEPSEDSWFFKNHGFKVRIKLSEEESWSALNSGRMAASATTVDVLAVYGRQFQVVVPMQIAFSRGADGIVVKDGIRSINQLKGGIVLTGQFTEAEFFLRYLASEAGIPVDVLADADSVPDPDKINLLFCEDAFEAADAFLAALEAGDSRIVGAVTWAPKTTETVAASNGKARLLVTNRNLLVIGDILVVNRGFAEANPEKVSALVEGVLEGNRRVRANPTSVFPLLKKAFGWSDAQSAEEIKKVHLSNLPENRSFFSGAIDAAGSFSGIYQSAVLAYGSKWIPQPVGSERFYDPTALEAIAGAGKFADEKISIAPIASSGNAALEQDPLLSRDIRFFFEPNSSRLDMNEAANLEQLAAIQRLMQVSPGSTILLRGHVDNALVAQFRQQGGDAFVQQMAVKAVALSHERASAIQRLLIERQSADPKRLEVIGRGWEEPIAGDSEANRRVEVQWFMIE